MLRYHTVKKIALGLFVLCIPSCMSYYVRYQKFNTDFEQGKLKEADAILESDKHAPKGKAHLLYYVNRGTINSYLGNYEESNDFFEQAYNISEVQSKTVLESGLSLLLNPKIAEYHGETFEVLLINYYKALNYLKLGKYDEALVECKRMDIRLNKLTDKFSSDAKYKRDAFVHLLMGIIYDVNQDYNNAFIAYRNALEIYEKDYAVKFNTPVPLQLKKDLLRTAYLTGFTDDVREYEDKFGMKYQHVSPKGKGEMLFLWHNGFGPEKEEWSIDFTLVDLGNGYVNFVNLGAGLTIPVFIGSGNNQGTQLKDVQIIRMALPKYVERPPIYSGGYLTTTDGTSYPVELAENINAIAFKSLHDRFIRDLGQALLRLALKKAAEIALRKENQDAGMVLGLFNAVSEQADTRNWQTLPYAIHYARVPLPVGESVVQFSEKANQGSDQKIPITANVREGQTFIYTISGQ